MRNITEKSSQTKLLIKKCHMCGQVVESAKEEQKCVSCGKSFLPLKYFDKIHRHSEAKYKDLFSNITEIEEDDLVKGLYVIW